MKTLKKKRFNWVEFLLVVPALVFYLVFVVYPLFGGFFYSMTDWNGISPDFNFVGLKNYVNLFHDQFVLEPLGNSVFFAFVSMILLNVLGLIFAVGLDNIAGKSFYRGLFYLPSVLGSLVVGYIFSFLFSMPFASIGQNFGWEVLANNALGNQDWALMMGCLVSAWKNVGWYMVIYIAGLQNVDKSLHEAAIIDGASSWKRFWSVTFPLIAPAFTINMILSVERAFKEYDLIFALTGGGPGRASELLSMTIYNESFTNKRAGYGSALGVILFLIIVAITLIQLFALRRRENDINY